MIIHWHDGENELDCKCPASDLWPDEVATVARFEAAETPREVLREKVAHAIYSVDRDDLYSDYLRMADAALAVIRGES